MQNKVMVLIIEDEKNICDFIATTLKAQGYKTITTGLGREGVSLTASQCPDIILLDLGLPDLDGMDDLPEGITGVESVEKIYEALLRRGHSEDLVRDIFYNNLIDILERAT